MKARKEGIEEKKTPLLVDRIELLSIIFNSFLEKLKSSLDFPSL